MTPQELYEEWTDGESSGVRPMRLQRLRNDIIRHTDLVPPRHIADIEDWTSRYNGEVTKRLAKEIDEDVDVDEEIEDDDAGDSEDDVEDDAQDAEIEYHTKDGVPGVGEVGEDDVE